MTARAATPLPVRPVAVLPVGPVAVPRIIAVGSVIARRAVVTVWGGVPVRRALRRQLLGPLPLPGRSRAWACHFLLGDAGGSLCGLPIGWKRSSGARGLNSLLAIPRRSAKRRNSSARREPSGSKPEARHGGGGKACAAPNREGSRRVSGSLVSIVTFGRGLGYSHQDEEEDVQDTE
jgi:hypothetical protein